MTKVLLISLSDDKELISSSFLINSIKRQNPNKEISILTYEDNRPIASLINNIDQIYTINRVEISNLYENKLFSQAFAINQFLDDLSYCSKIIWNEIINYTNNQTSSYLSTYLNSERVLGTSYTQNLHENNLSEWEAYESYNSDQNIISKAFSKHYLAGVHFFEEGARLKINNEFNSIASENFKRIRRSKGQNQSYIVGISLMRDSHNSRLNITSLSNIIESLELSKHYRPVLIIGNNPVDKEICNKLNENFNNQLISITADTDAITSVISNIDILITTDNIHMEIAQTSFIPVIEITSSDSNSSIIMPNSYSIKSDNYMFHDEASFILNNSFENELPVESISKHAKVYQSISDEYSSYFTQISGDICIEKELNYHISRAYHFELMGESINKDLLQHISAHTERDELLNFIELNKNELTKCVKTLLATLRSLKGIDQSHDNKINFVNYLDDLFSYSNSKSLIATPVRLFLGRVENIESKDKELNFKEIESLLFNLKNKLQKLTNIFEVLISKGVDDTQVAKM